MMRSLVFAAVAAALAAALAVAACTPKPPPPAPPSPLILPPMVVTVPADQPVAPPACPWNAPQPIVDITRAWGNYASGCESPTTGYGYLYNLSGQVLEVSVSQPCSCMRVYGPPGEDAAMPTIQSLVPSVQYESVYLAAQAERLPSDQRVLVPVDGSVYLTPPMGSSIGVSVAVDPVASGASYAAKMLAAYVIDNLVRSDLEVGYYDAISHCVNAIQDSWHQFSQPDSSTSEILDSALGTVRECKDLQEKLAEDPNEEQHVLAVAGQAAVSESDVAKVVDATGEAGWKDEITAMLENPVVDDILEGAH